VRHAAHTLQGECTPAWRAPQQSAADRSRPQQTAADRSRPQQTAADRSRPQQTAADRSRAQQTAADRSRPQQSGRLEVMGARRAGRQDSGVLHPPVPCLPCVRNLLCVCPVSAMLLCVCHAALCLSCSVSVCVPCLPCVRYLLQPLRPCLCLRVAALARCVCVCRGAVCRHACRACVRAYMAHVRGAHVRGRCMCMGYRVYPMHMHAWGREYSLLRGGLQRRVCAWYLHAAWGA
jgi:hypothetical protein